MHRTKETTPNKDADDKLRILGLRGGKVLDTCMGLGYTAVGAIIKGAEVVVSVERESTVIRVAEIGSMAWILSWDPLNPISESVDSSSPPNMQI